MLRTQVYLSPKRMFLLIEPKGPPVALKTSLRCLLSVDISCTVMSTVPPPQSTTMYRPPKYTFICVQCVLCTRKHVYRSSAKISFIFPGRMGNENLAIERDSSLRLFFGHSNQSTEIPKRDFLLV
jgi:hypothetical protein